MEKKTKVSKPHLVAVYGSLKRSMHNFASMKALGSEHYEFVGATKTKPEYNLFPVAGFPGMTENGSTAVEIEVFAVSDELLKGPLDRLEGYDEDRDPSHNHYNRKLIFTEYGQAYTYIYNRGTRSPLIEDGDWEKYYNSQY